MKVVGALLLLAALVGCSSEDGGTGGSGPATTSTTTPVTGEPASWDLDPDDAPDASATTFTALVSRLGCNDGETGVVLPPTVEETDDEVVVTFTVEPARPGDHTCPGNQPVPSLVHLDRPISDRVLVDGGCRAPADLPGPLCERNGVRHAPAGG